MWHILEGLSDWDLDVLRIFIERGAPFPNATLEESAALERLSAAATLKMSSDPLSKPTPSIAERRPPRPFGRAYGR
jgi:hypothetical protein